MLGANKNNETGRGCESGDKLSLDEVVEMVDTEQGIGGLTAIISEYLMAYLLGGKKKEEKNENT